MARWNKRSSGVRRRLAILSRVAILPEESPDLPAAIKVRLIVEFCDPEFKSVVEEAAWFCWQNSRLDYSPIQDRLNFMQAYLPSDTATGGGRDSAFSGNSGSV